MKKWSKVFCSAVLMGTMVMAAGCGGGGQQAQTPAPSDADKQKPVEKTTYIVGTNPVFEPFEYVDKEDNIVGFDMELIQAIGQDQGFEVEFKNLEFDALTAEIQTGSIDIIASGMSIDEERKKVVDFSEPYIDASLSVVVAEGNDEIKGIDDLEGKIVAAQIGTTGAKQCYELEEAGKVKEVKILADYDLCMLELVNGSVDAVINDIPVTQAYMAKNPGTIKMVGDSLADDQYGFAVAKGNTELLEKINAGLANVKESGVYDELLVKYIAGEGAPEAAPEENPALVEEGAEGEAPAEDATAPADKDAAAAGDDQLKEAE